MFRDKRAFAAAIAGLVLALGAAFLAGYSGKRLVSEKIAPLVGRTDVGSYHPAVKHMSGVNRPGFSGDSVS